MRHMERAGTLLSNRSFLALWLGQLVSNLGDKLLQINAIGFALASARAGSAMAQVLIWATLPALLLGLLAGVVVDRANRRQIMIVSDLTRAALLGVLPFAAAQGFWAVCVVIALVASAACFFGPARTALIPATVPGEQLVAANAWFAASGFFTALVGTAAGGWLLAGLGLKISLWINAGVFCASALAIALARLPQPLRHAAGRTVTTTLAELKAGLGVVTRHHAVRACMLHYALLMGIATASYVGLIGLAGQHQALGLQHVSILLTAAVIGLVIGGLIAHRLHARLSVPRAISAGLGLIAVASLVVAKSTSLVTLASGLMALGAGGALYAAVIEASLQRVLPDRLRGRVLAARGVLASFAVLLTSTGAGWAIDHAGKDALFGFIAALATVATLVTICLSTKGLVYQAVRWSFRHLSFAYLRLQVQGLDHLPAQGGVIVAGNHPNVMDGLLLLIASPRPVRFLIAEEMYEHRFLHGMFRAMGCIPVYRTKTHNGDALRGAVAALERGEVLGIFPEGTTSYRGSMEAVRKGVALLALKTGAPVVPLAIRGSYEAYPPGAKVPKPWPVFLRFEAPAVYPKTLAQPIPEEQVAATLEDIRRRILSAMKRLSHEWTWEVEGEWIKRLRIAASSLVIAPLTAFLTLTANPSLDPVERR